LGFGVWGWGFGGRPPNPQTPIPNPQSPITEFIIKNQINYFENNLL